MSLKERLNLRAEPVFLVDGSAFVYRGFYAFRDMSTREGFPTNALFVVLRMIMKILREEKPRALGFFLDGKGPTFRNEIYSEYKAQRQATPEDLLVQIEPIKEALRLFGLPVIVSEGGEADDCIASLAERLRDSHPVVIVGADKDLKQCLAERVWLWDPAGKQDKLTGLAEFTGETGLAPSSWPDFQALTGDSSDNIPGIPGIGPKSATEIMARFPTLEAIWQGLDELPEKYRKKLDGRLEDALRWRELTRLRTTFCHTTDLAALTPAAPDIAGLKEFMARYEFGSLARELSTLPAPSKAAPAASPSAKAGGMSLLDYLDGPKAEPERAANRVASVGELPDLSGAHAGLAPLPDGMALGLDGRELLYTGDEAALAKALAKARSLAAPSVKGLLARPGTAGGWRALPFATVRDLGLMAYLLNPEEREYGLTHLLAAYEADPDMPPLPGGHAPGDAPGLAARALGELLAKRLKAAGMERLYAELELPLLPVLRDMEEAGVAIDLRAFESFLDEVTDKLAELTEAIREAAGLSPGEEFNVRSSHQLADLLFNRLSLKPRGKTPGGLPSTSQAVLEKMAGEHPVIDLVLTYRGYEKMRSTYLEPLPRLVGQDGRIHTTFNNLSTATGRLSSSNPNLQNIPIRGEMGGRMRACFTAGPGRLLASADYSQIELRLLAHLCGDPELTKAFAAGEDIHARTAAILHGKEPGEVTPDERRAAKTINFGLLYGMGPQRLSRELKITLTLAKEFITRYFERMPAVKDFFEGVERDARRDGYVTTMFGRRRLLPGLFSRNDNEQAQAVRQAINTRVQGSAADIIKLAMLRAHEDERLRALGARLILQVHDELVIEAPKDAAREAGERLAEIMTSAVDISVPLAVDWGVGPTWAEAH